ncbi:MAG: rubrerythrin [Azospirillum sp.]|nr:rubrerythrin [Azospirillum sp.]
MDSVTLFLAHAIALEAESAERFETLAGVMHDAGNFTVALLFRQMARFSRIHQAEIQDHAEGCGEPLPEEDGLIWLSDSRSELVAPADLTVDINAAAALDLVIRSERVAQGFYAGIAKTTDNPAIQELAEEFALEEADHVMRLETCLAEQLNEEPPHSMAS